LNAKSTEIHSPVWQSYEIQQLLRLMEPQGVDAESILQGTSITLSMFDNPALRFSLEQELALYIALAEHNQDELLALEHGQRMGLNFFGVLGTLMLCSDTLAIALHHLQKYFPLVSWASFITLLPNSQAHTIDILMVPTPAGEKTGRFEVESTFMSILTLIKQITMSQVTFERITLAYKIDADLQNKYQAYFQCPVEFSANENKISIRQDDFYQTLPAADESVIEVLMALCQKTYEKLKNNRGLVGAVRQLLENADNANLSLDELAKLFNLSGRTLRRRLKEAGTGYQQVLESVRYEKAKQLLKCTDLNIDNIAYQLGYSDSRSFRQAFKRWTNTSPGEFRLNIIDKIN
jgi:AraC-like DNA-binding protein